ncbi:MAG: ethanolamine ammonia-lyase reactivating factor EutA [Proteobacteria bacterium]|nr:ethanolamine ammonia-lyase reactivating factor EutA [Desulfobacteraceae bacterium]MBL7172885.1 ethanolamine ammonia-lyase reactivating factor EutA [Desulfobacteraceae bacterium]MBU0734584.1 ethanolamine ammonia-lyase reactivating factor EutA [Pseudomonadota bacterium]MBU0989162.1 ethanolamine ammonia-lyase reactivating factor EutA [Pseudomonadota bacterium]MBU1903667.1 ethanolamine ammonia-lyase reactivating factor EutA [Pseudomonadota bacterium]
MEINKIELLSVGVDVGTSTSHLVFSNLVLERDPRSPSRRFLIRKREIIYEGRIINTPLLPDDTIDTDTLSEFFREEYGLAGIDPADIQSGAVIVTGETAKKDNARQIVEAISNGAGDFVAATAGANFESLLTAMGSGATARSKDYNKTILSCDIGGGTSNIAISRKGEVLSTSCISVGGRLLAADSEGRIWRLDEPAMKVMEQIGLNYRIGDHIPRSDIERIATRFAEVLIEVITGPATSLLARQLMLTDDIHFPGKIDEYSFSGGIAELIYGGNGNYDDMGNILADKINSLIPTLTAPVVEPKHKIRATVIGAGAYSLSISGSSGFMDDKISFPIRNVPVIRVDVDPSRLSVEHVISRTRASFRRFDLKEGEEVVALYFKDPVRAYYPELELFAKSIEAALTNSIDNKIPIILIFETDIACSVGNVIRRETGLKTNLLSMDELILNEGDWIDIGEPLVAGQVFPVTVKSLIFNKN